MKKRLSLLLLLLAPAAWLAASTGGEASHAVDWLGVLAKVFNSTVLFGGLILLLRKPLIQMLSRKSADIQADIVGREKELDAAQQRLRDIGERLSRVAAEVERIQEGAEAAGREELSRLQEAGRQEAERIIALSEEEIRQRVDAAVRAVKGRIADLAIDRFRSDFARGLDAATQHKIVERNIDACGDLSRAGAGRAAGERDEGK